MYAGLDVGSRTIKLVSFSKGVRDFVVVETGVNPLARCQQIVSGKDFERLVVTGYGRHLVAPVLRGTTVSEIKAFAVGARHLYPDCHSVIDIGGQDSKVILLSEKGEILKFEMNDRCAAGTGKFLEIMASTLEVPIEGLADLASRATSRLKINSLCTVFAESEVVSLIARGQDAASISLALHEAIASRLIAMVRKVGTRPKVILAGGVSLNKCLVGLLEQNLEAALTVPDSPQIVGAVGAAILARDGMPI